MTSKTDKMNMNKQENTKKDTNKPIGQKNHDSTVKGLIESYKDDPELAAAINVDELLNALSNEKNEHLDNKTLENIAEEKYKQLKSLNVKSDLLKELFSKLAEYRHIDEIYQLHKGKHVRWIRNDIRPVKLTNGGIVVDIKFLDTGTHILVMTTNPRCKYIQYKFDECITFQKLSTDEQLILAAYEYAGQIQPQVASTGIAP